MKMAFRPQLGYILMDAATGNRLANLTDNDARDMMFGHITYDRRKSFLKPNNREWSDGAQW